MDDRIAVHHRSRAPIRCQRQVPTHTAGCFFLELDVGTAEIGVVVVVDRAAGRVAIRSIEKHERAGLLVLVIDIGRGDHAADLQTLEAGGLGPFLDARHLHIGVIGHLGGFVGGLLVVCDLRLLLLDLGLELLHLGLEGLQLVQDVGVGVGMRQWGEPQAGRQHGEFELVHGEILQGLCVMSTG
ncbi:hypothetical protein GALL_513690 [mine drainage metagenome]|uniref:Uncharacterized protein n=1 Tax=mine drainage metagenome TaxID=410659 RepID=A0A1J5P772_9ZZZZ